MLRHDQPVFSDVTTGREGQRERGTEGQRERGREAVQAKDVDRDMF